MKLGRFLFFFRVFAIAVPFLGTAVRGVFAASETTYDVVVYGGTSAGVIAAIQVSQLGKTVVLIEPSGHLGGLTAGGLGVTDVGNKQAIGGMSREFYRRVRQHYNDPNHWKHGTLAQFSDKRNPASEDAMWFFEPSVAQQIFKRWLAETDVVVELRQRLASSNPLQMKEDGIATLQTESGQRFSGEVFIDATYEGDLMAAAGVSYMVGREPNALYNETLSGVQVKRGTAHQLAPGVDPYVEPGSPESGVLPGINPDEPAEEGSGDRRVQAYNLRLCLTDVAENRIAISKPVNYRELDYELLLRNFEAGETEVPWGKKMMPNRKTDCNNRQGFSTDFIGQSYEWPEATFDRRQEIYQQHVHYTQGLLWTLANHPRVPESVRKEVSRWGLCKGEFVESSGFSPQLYVREARRMVSDYVMTQQHCQGHVKADYPIGMAAYTMDSHHVQRFINKQGHVQNEGDVQVRGFPPYPIDYRAIVPRKSECQNLLVPVCLSASHIAFGSIRMEPVFMILGQSAAVAACQAIDERSSVQEIELNKLSTLLREGKQILN